MQVIGIYSTVARLADTREQVSCKFPFNLSAAGDTDALYGIDGFVLSSIVSLDSTLYCR